MLHSLKFEEYKDAFRYLTLRRENGILEVRMHYNDGPAKWSGYDVSLHSELPELFQCVTKDPENKIMIFTGTGHEFLAEWDRTDETEVLVSPQQWHRLYKDGKELIHWFLDIEIPIIAAVNGKCFIHPELPTLCDVVIASETSVFADKAHLTDTRAVPGDGSHVWWPMLLGPNRGRSFLILGEEIPAAEAKTLGFVAEVVPQDAVLDRAWEIARTLITHDPLVLKYTRISLTQHMKRRFLDDLGYGLALEGLGILSLAQNASKSKGWSFSLPSGTSG
ncbi:enoyl-CoA hydratase/isomerase [Lophium mytilinum]|uniref:Enoyl-CoA hydratase/isomerase n=1 Tax=Lophium mytilinum TaxID=390894 RepID=A0A6A6R9G9_9PEZI|nr:enoyl-CoA hydratase/isomerase [Lophium mytilinum]